MHLDGPYKLGFDQINAMVNPDKAGVFALGYGAMGGVFYVNYIGRADDDLRSRLLDFIGSDVEFKFRVIATSKEAFVKECELFHDFRPPGNRLHPVRPPLSGWVCPRCSFLGSR